MRDTLGNVDPVGNFFVKQPDVIEQLVNLLLDVRFTQLVTLMVFCLQLTGSKAHTFTQKIKATKISWYRATFWKHWGFFTRAVRGARANARAHTHAHTHAGQPHSVVHHIT